MTTSDEAVIEELMDEIARAEDRGDTDFFDALLHPMFVMQRPNGQFEDRSGFIGRMAAGGTRRSGRPEIHVFGNRAVAWVEVSKREGDQWVTFHNVRALTRETPESGWCLIAWLNEPA